MLSEKFMAFSVQFIRKKKRETQRQSSEKCKQEVERKEAVGKTVKSHQGFHIMPLDISSQSSQWLSRRDTDISSLHLQSRTTYYQSQKVLAIH